MVDERSFQSWRRLLILFNLFYLSLAILFFVFAMTTRFSSWIIDSHLFIGLIISSIFLTCLSLFGIFAVIKHHQVLLFFYVILLGILFTFQFILASTYLGHRVEKNVETFEKYANQIQLKYNCCTYDNETTVDRSTVCGQLPCCQSTQKCCETWPPCFPIIRDELRKTLKIIGSIMLIFTLSEILAIYLNLQYRNMRNPLIAI